ncbi:hypothetical protein [Burkholderia cepacia]|uniref:hypothetical protein n=1 Tax=Burkholderia cepacia TaxID=292 RepID=UPI000AEE52CC|nr:hypothetical protein [Burkholderia cepacia]
MVTIPAIRRRVAGHQKHDEAKFAFLGRADGTGVSMQSHFGTEIFPFDDEFDVRLAS